MKASERFLMRKVERGFCHSYPMTELGPRERKTAFRLVLRGWLFMLEPRGRFPMRLVTTGAGSHAIGTFANARMS